MKTTFDPKKNEWLGSTADRLPGHDLYFGTPENRPTAGLPIGDGDTGSLLWIEKDGLHIHVNKCDLWQDAPRGVTWDDECYCSGHEEELTCVKHGGEITLRFGAPVFDYLYQQSFTARLCLKDAAAVIDSVTPFSSLHAFAFAENGVSVLRVDYESAEPDMPEIRLIRFGSRTLWHWYWKQKFVPETSLEGTNSFTEGDDLFITQTLSPTRFCIGLRFVSDEKPARTRRVNSHTAAIELNDATRRTFTLFWTVKTGNTVDEAKQACFEALQEARNIGEDALFEEHRRAWAAFWERSLIALPDDYLENIVYLYLYYMNSESRGKYPPHFTNGLWGFYHDFVPWNYYFHYNEQHMYLPLDTLGHGELLRNYFDLRKNGMSACRLFADRIKKKQGIFLHDVTDRYGRGAEYHRENCTPGAQVALHMWRHYRFTGDMDFLLDTALPFMRVTVQFYLDMLQKESDGVFHLHGTSAYEGTGLVDDSITDLVMIRMLFPIYLPFADRTTKERIMDALSNLYQPISVPMRTPEDTDGTVFSFGVGKGNKPLGDGTVFAVGRVDGKPVRKSFGDPHAHEEVEAFPDVELSPLYPAGLIGLKDRGSPIYDTLLNQMSLHPTGDQTGHWNMLPIFLSRIGDGDEMLKTVRSMLSNYQGFPNGFNAEGGEVGNLVGDAPAFYPVENYETEEKHLLRTDGFVHFDFETEPIVTAALLEGLLQSYEGILRICPAAAFPSAFSLFAEGGFTVCAQCEKNGFVITVASERGERCLIRLPEAYSALPLYVYVKKQDTPFVAARAEKTTFGADEALLIQSLCAGDTALLCSEPIERLDPFAPSERKPNREMKTCGKAVLGSPSLMR